MRCFQKSSVDDKFDSGDTKLDLTKIQAENNEIPDPKLEGNNRKFFSVYLWKNFSSKCIWIEL